MNSILSVRELTENVRQVVEARLPYVWVRGEVTNLSRPSSGHVYFSLKEDDYLLNCVWFRHQQKQETFDPLTGEVWADGPHPSLALGLENGQTLICAGRLTIYGARSQYQMLVDMAQAEGLGLWHQEFESLKRRLAAEGLFDASHKRPLPREPRRVAVVTAPSGAAIQDFIRISAERGLAAEIRIHPALVQGEDAPPAIVQALHQAGHDGWAQVIVLIRGGGSLQDLWAFNDERVARAIHASPVPVLTGIGHEIDHSIADFTADASAATPSHTAQLLWQERTAFAQGIDNLELSLSQAMELRFRMLKQILEHCIRALGMLSPNARLLLHDERLNGLAQRMGTALKTSLDRSSRRIEQFSSSLSGLPDRIDRQQALLDSLSLRLAGSGENRLSLAEQDAERTAWQFRALGRSLGMAQEHMLSQLDLRLHSVNPERLLQCGYAMVHDSAGTFLRSVHDTAPGRRVSITLSDGSILSTVDAVVPATSEEKNRRLS